ncbi:hypothetical protein BB558_003570, partial [Smittium angustum]
MKNQPLHANKHNPSISSSSSSSNLSKKPSYRFGSFEPVQEDTNLAPKTDSLQTITSFINSIFSAVTPKSLSPSNKKSTGKHTKAFITLFLIFLAFIYNLFQNILVFVLGKNKNTVKQKQRKSDQMSHNRISGLKVEKMDIIVITTMIVGAATFIFRKFIFGSKDNSSSISQKTLKNSNNSQNVSGSSKSAIDVERNIAEQMKLKNKNVVLAFGSQTGTAEDLAKRVSRELQQDFGARTMVIDPEDFEIETLSRIQPNSILVLLMSTTGEGEPTDNMTGWYDKLIGIDNLHSVDFSEAEMIEFEEPEPNEFESDPDYTFDYDNPLANLHFAAFGLGNTTYEHFNSHVKQVSKRLQSLGATLVGEIGLGDDDMDIDEDFENWEAANLPLIGKHIGSTPQSDEDA